MKIIIKLIKRLLRRKGAHEDSQNKNKIPRKAHLVSKTDISGNALKVVNRLLGAGFEAYIVGGGVRDLMQKQAPKDFDVATNATPGQVRGLFRNARIIGRRFKLVHVIFHREIIEVATFRGQESHDEHHVINEKGMVIRDNVYGTLEEDAWRRDFTINSLYYDVRDASIVDFTGGVEDIHQKQIRIIGDPQTRYQEDPVRMLRAIRFSAKLGFDIENKTHEPLLTLAPMIQHVSASRLFEEMVKCYHCGAALTLHQLLISLGFFPFLFPETAALMVDHNPVQRLIQMALKNTDHRIAENKPVTPAFFFAIFLWFPMLHEAGKLQDEGIPPLEAIERAMSYVISRQTKVISIPKRFTQAIREIWLMQYRLEKRSGVKAFQLLEHPRFRASYDFLGLRALVDDAPMELADWWTQFQEASFPKQQDMIKALKHPNTGTTSS